MNYSSLLALKCDANDKLVCETGKQCFRKCVVILVSGHKRDRYEHRFKFIFLLTCKINNIICPNFSASQELLILIF